MTQKYADVQPKKKTRKPTKREEKIIKSLRLINDVAAAAQYGKGTQRVVLMISRTGIRREFNLYDAISACFEAMTGESAKEWLEEPEWVEESACPPT